ncbi:LLM class flavin-dependent oxidoreductase [Streptomyces sp. NPDC058067]|uniref:LLM class flavin-dependent oxidoreductase n=1 Tax=Streptomyces sp. NPDC058067 TaxID=3346324 RepID=UPI0036E19F32
MPENHPLLHWYLPARRPADVDSLARTALAAESAGFDSLAIPAGGPDPWVLASALCRRTERIGFLVALPAEAARPTVIAQQADAFRRFAGGRLRLDVGAHGAGLTHDQRYGRTDEVMAVVRDLLDGRRIDFQGEHVQVEGAQLTDPAVEHPVPLYFGGESPAADGIAARRADVRLVRSAPPEAVAERVARTREQGAGERATRGDGSRLRYGIRLRVVGRAEASEAWDAAGRIPDDGRTGAGEDAVVGTYDEVARRLAAYRRAGIDEFILYGCPCPDEPARVAGEILPRLRALADAAVACGG